MCNPCGKSFDIQKGNGNKLHEYGERFFSVTGNCDHRGSVAERLGRRKSGGRGFKSRGGIPFLSRLGLKTGIDFEHFGLKLDMVIGGMFTKAYKLIFLPSNRGE